MTTIATTQVHREGAGLERRFGSLILRIHGSGPRGERLRPERLGGAALAMILVRDGAATVADADGVRGLRAGEVLVVDPGAHLALRLEPATELAILLVPDSLARATGASPASLVGRILAAADGRGALVAAIVDGLLALPDAAAEQRAARLAEHAVGLLAWSVEPVDTAVHARSALARAAKDEIEARLADVELGPEAIARTLNVSTRTLHRSMEADGASVAGWLRRRRLERCRVELADPAFAGMSIGEIGARWGLCDAAHLSRTFKDAYGQSPRAYRQTHVAHDCAIACVGA